MRIKLQVFIVSALLINSAAIGYLLVVQNKLEQKIDQLAAKKPEHDSIGLASLKQKVRTLSSKGRVQHSKISSLENEVQSRRAIGSPQSIEQLNQAKKVAFLMQLKINRFYKQKRRFPQTRDELKSVLGKIPPEASSNSNRITFDRDSSGGWFYNMQRGKIEVNSR